MKSTFGAWFHVSGRFFTRSVTVRICAVYTYNLLLPLFLFPLFKASSMTAMASASFLS